MRNYIFVLMVLLPYSAHSSKNEQSYSDKFEKMVLNNFKTMRVLKLSDLDQDTLTYAKKNKLTQPGKVCGAFNISSEKGCAFVLIDKKSKIGASLIVFISDSMFRKNTYDIIEDYRNEKVSKTNIYIKLHLKESIQNRGEGPDKIEMQSDGISRVAAGQSEMVFFYANEKLQKVWTSD